MPIHVIGLSYSKRKNKHLSRVMTKPGLTATKTSGVSHRVDLRFNKQGSEILTGLGKSKKMLENAPQVYTIAELDKLTATLNASITKNKSDCSNAISASLETIQQEIKNLKELILNDPVFRESIMQELKEEIRLELLAELEN